MSAAPRERNANLVGLDLDALGRYLQRADVPTTGALQGRLLAGGRSNLTYLVVDDAYRWVLRRPPLGHVLATAHDMRREYRVLDALADSAVPTPATVAYCEDPDVLGAPFYLMEHVRGPIYRTDAELADLSPQRAAALGDQLVDVLMELHSVDPASVGLADFGRPVGFLQRQLKRWSTQLAASRSRTVPGFDALAAALAAEVPTTQRHCIVHGDYRLDNVIIAPDSAAIRAVLDWEMATLGDPLTDLALLAMYWDGWAGLADNPISAVPGDHAGFPGRDRLIERYAGRTGLDLSRFDWYLSFAFYKFAVILEGIHHRYLQGQTVGEGYDRIGDMVPTLVQRGLAQLRKRNN